MQVFLPSSGAEPAQFGPADSVEAARLLASLNSERPDRMDMDDDPEQAVAPAADPDADMFADPPHTQPGNSDQAVGDVAQNRGKADISHSKSTQHRNRKTLSKIHPATILNH